MLPVDWLHVNGVSLSTDIHQPASHTSDYRSKHVTSPTLELTSPMISSPNSIPFTSAAVDGQQNNRQHYQKLENTDLPKKLFIDRQIKKVKSLPGLIKGTALSRHISLHTASNGNQNDSNPTTNNNSNNNSQPSVAIETDTESSPSRQYHERTNETRRPRVSFSEFHKIQFYEDTNDSSQQSPHRRHRHRSSKKIAAFTGNNYVSPPSIQHPQILQNNYSPLSRQQLAGQELNIKKQLLFPSPRGHSSRITHLPDILSQSGQMETSVHEKYVFQGEKDSSRLPESTFEIPINSSTEISRESTRAGGIRSSALQDYHDQNNKLDAGDSAMNSVFINGSLSSSLTSRQRPLRTISLRQQFNSPTRSKPSTTTNNNLQIVTNPRRSASLKHTAARMNSIDDDHEELPNNGLASIGESRPTTGMNSSKPLKADYIIHFNSKNPSNGQTTMDSIDRNRYTVKSNFYESSQERFHNVLKVVRPPYIATITNSNNESKLQTTMNNTTNGSVRSSHTNSGHEAHDYHITSNTIFV
ncbi:unnamed protein product [Rotaria socialis]|uniref:Uncharacterized protein n=1 Tax=Rotaria socialis TaxID=392032 RepID=A0A820HWN2_9BILA|nr:unnamed protein product [Rotaria socialis]CAF4300087.1 unnamed protein product [Rotaria socialis]